MVESFFSSLKKERIKKQIYKNRAIALADVADYIDTFYNRTRRQGHATTVVAIALVLKEVAGGARRRRQKVFVDMPDQLGWCDSHAGR